MSPWLSFFTYYTTIIRQREFTHPHSISSEYYGRMVLWPGASSNSSSRDYLCVPSFVWTYLIPRLLYAFGYVAIFACIFCLHMHDLETVVARVSDRWNGTVCWCF